MRDIDFSNIEPLSRPVPQRRPWVVPVLIAVLVVALVGIARADDFQCMKEEGCYALLPGDHTSRRVLFYKGEIIGTSGGWIVNPADGWDRMDAIFLPGCAP